MAMIETTVQARIVAVRGSVLKDSVERDWESEARVRTELRQRLEKEERLRKMSDAEFQNHYRERLRNYAPYANGRFVPENQEDGKPGILVPKKMWEHELELEYYVGRTRYTRSVAYKTETNALDRSSALYLTVNENDPMQIIGISEQDSRQQGTGCAGGSFAVILVLLIAICYILQEYFL